MDSQKSVADLKVWVKEFCEDRDWDQYHGPHHLAVGIVTEAAELLDLFRFYEGEGAVKVLEKKRPEVEEEIADAFFFLLRFAQFYDIDLSAALERKMAKNDAKYPVEKAKGSNRKYHEL